MNYFRAHSSRLMFLKLSSTHISFRKFTCLQPDIQKSSHILAQSRHLVTEYSNSTCSKMLLRGQFVWHGESRRLFICRNECLVVVFLVLTGDQRDWGPCVKCPSVSLIYFKPISPLHLWQIPLLLSNVSVISFPLLSRPCFAVDYLLVPPHEGPRCPQLHLQLSAQIFNQYLQSYGTRAGNWPLKTSATLTWLPSELKFRLMLWV